MDLTQTYPKHFRNSNYREIKTCDLFVLNIKRISPTVVQLKSSRSKKDLNDVTAAPFSVSFSQLPAAKRTVQHDSTVYTSGQ